MNAAPLILVAPSTERKGAEFYDYSISLSDAYLQSLISVGGLPLILPCHPSQKVISEFVRRCDGIMLSGGDDIQPELYNDKVPPKIRKTSKDHDPLRDLAEVLLIKEAFAQRKPLLAICRGHQLVNVALGGTLLVDIASQSDTKLNHARLDMKDKIVHEMKMAPGSLIHSIFKSDTVGINSSHHQAIDILAEPLAVTGIGPDGIIEATELKPSSANLLPFYIGVQFHPERLVKEFPPFGELFRAFVTACTQEKIS